MQWGFEKMRVFTDKMKERAVFSDRNSMRFELEGEFPNLRIKEPFLRINIYGETDTTGSRAIDVLFDTRIRSYLGRFGMDREGLQLSHFDSGFNRYVNWTSKVHDFFNSWRYSDHGLFIPFKGQIMAEVFEIYNFVGMPVAGAYTSIAKFGNELLLVDNTVNQDARRD